MSVRRFACLVVIALSLAACKRPLSISFKFYTPPPSDQLKRAFWALPDFSLTERSGRAVTLADLKGKVWVADFFYSTCPGPCPMLSSRMSELQKQLASEDRVRLVSISTDPEKDTPDALTAYAEKFHANERWLFLTGPKAAIHDLARNGFKLPIAENPGSAEPIIHSNRLILVDQTGVIRGVYEGIGGDGSEPIVRDIRRLLDSKP